MKIFEKIILGFAILSMVLKFFLIPGGGLLFAVSFLILSGFYFYLGFAYFNNLKFKDAFVSSTYNNISKKRLIGGIGSGIALAILITGLMFKFMNWPLQKIYILMGLTLIIIIISTIIIKTKGNLDLYYKRIVNRLIIFGLLGFIFFLIPNSTIIKAQFRNYPRFIKAYNNFQNNPNDTSLKDSMDKERDRIFMSDKGFEYRHKEKK